MVAIQGDFFLVPISVPLITVSNVSHSLDLVGDEEEWWVVTNH